MKGVRYVHTNMIARDWRALASFYWCYVTDPEGNIIELQAWS